MLQADAIDLYYGGSQALRGVSLQVGDGCTVLLGRNGVGKTSLLKCIMGLLPIRAGKLAYAGQDITRLAPHQRARLGIGFVPQGRDIFPRLTVRENLLIGAAAKGGAADIPAHIFDTFPVLAEMLHRRGGDLSGGQQQQLAIGRALMSDPRLLILDEPTEGIQPSIVKDIERVIRALAASGKMAILLVEQYFDFAAGLADRYYVMNRGQVVLSGKGADMEADGVRQLVAV